MLGEIYHPTFIHTYDLFLESEVKNGKIPILHRACVTKMNLFKN